ncbi:MAG: hypothetical protein ACRC20_17710 [Segniliparus sp.]|uniref:hypothetical protein n=1 Tax=Segniliparus sp. TaxID=2804064 RepID=UPI003F32867F
MRSKSVFAALAFAGLLAAPAAEAQPLRTGIVGSPSGKINCLVNATDVKCIAPWGAGVAPAASANIADYHLDQNYIQWTEGGFGGVPPRQLSYGVPITDNGWTIDAEENGLTFKKDGKGVFVSVQDVHAL